MQNERRTIFALQKKKQFDGTMLTTPQSQRVVARGFNVRFHVHAVYKLF